VGILLREVKVKCFRFFCSEKTFKFDNGIIVVAGPVGVGKSSLLDAVEFGVFGTCFGVRRRMYSKLDLIHDGCDSAEVEVVLEAEGEGLYRVVRRIGRKGSEEAVLYDPSGEVFRRRNIVNEILRELLGLDVAEFERTVYLNQVFLYTISYGSPALRSRVIDSLLGIEALEKISALVSRYARFVEERVKAVEEEVAEIESEVESLEREAATILPESDVVAGELEAKRAMVSEKRKRLGEVSEELKRLKKSVEEYYRLQGLREYLREQLGGPPPPREELVVEFEKARLRLRDVAKDLLLEEYLKEVDEIGESKEVLEERVKRLKSVLDKIWDIYHKRLENLSELSIERERRRMILSQLEKRIIELDPIIKEYEKLEQTLDTLRKEYGDEKSVRRRLSDLELKYKMLEAAQFDRKCIVELRTRLKKRIQEKGTVKCPVCGSQIQSILAEDLAVNNVHGDKERLESEIKRLREVLERINEVKVKLVEYEEAIVQYRELVDRRESLLSEIDSLSSQIEQAEIKYREIGSRLAAIERDLDFIDEALKKLDLSKKLDEIEDRLEELRGLYSRYTLLQEEQEKLRQSIEELSREIEDLEDELEEKRRVEEELEALRSRLGELEERRERYKGLATLLYRVAEAYRRIQGEVRQEMVGEVTGHLREILRAIYPYRDIEDVRLAVEEKKGKSIYSLEVRVGGEWNSFSSRLSEGQKMIVVLALLAAFFKTVKHNAGFLLLDEPVPNVDVRVKERVFRGLSETLGLRQVVFTTQAVDVAKSLEGAEVLILERGRGCAGK